MDIGRTLPADVSGELLLAEVLSYKSLYEALSRLVQDAVIQLDAATKVVRWNLAAEALTGYSAQRSIGNYVRDFLADNELQKILAIPRDASAHEMRFTFVGPAAERTEVRAYVAALKSGEEPDGWLITCMSARHTDEIEQLKNEFVSTVSHELKTPPLEHLPRFDSGDQKQLINQAIEPVCLLIDHAQVLRALRLTEAGVCKQR